MHFRWVLQQLCYYYPVYNASTCTQLYEVLPSCLEDVEFAYEHPSPANAARVMEKCGALQSGDLHGALLENLDMKV